MDLELGDRDLSSTETGSTKRAMCQAEKARAMRSTRLFTQGDNKVLHSKDGKQFVDVSLPCYAAHWSNRTVRYALLSLLSLQPLLSLLSLLSLLFFWRSRRSCRPADWCITRSDPGRTDGPTGGPLGETCT
ncbi:hypothetical protein RB195_013742 [Necator americanus]|uniref:Uncharacterized protein n=1 Tax=Necator americanus TaxID=51031 RepID=A0ABR1DX10_NECAM